MTVGTQVKQALATAKTVQANFETYALQTQDKIAKQTYTDAARQLQEVIADLEMRLREIEQEEPTFRTD